MTRKTLWSLILAALLLACSAALFWIATGDVDNVPAMGQADYEQMQCLGSELPECRSIQVAEIQQ